MDSQTSPHASISIRPTLPQQISGARPAQVPAGYPTAPPYLPVDIMMYHSTAPLVIPNPSAVSQCVITPPFFCQTCMMYSTTNNPCSVHQTPIAYGQASSSYSAPNANQQATQQVVTNTQTSAEARALHHATSAIQQTAANQQRREAIEMTRQSNVPSLPNPARSVTMRMKRGQPIPARVQQSLESITQRPAKLRRVASDGSREIQAIRAEVQQQESTPSTSQLVTGTVPSTHACPGCTPGQRCPACAQCFCNHCPLSSGGHGHISTSSSLLLAAQTTPFMSQLTAQQQLQQQQVQQFRYDSMMANQMQQFYVQQHQQQAHHHHHQHQHQHQAQSAPTQPHQHPSVAAVAAAAAVQQVHQQHQQQQLQQQLQHQQIFSRLLPRSHSLFLLPSRTAAGVTPVSRDISRTRADRLLRLQAGFELNTMLVNVVPSELIMDRPILERHHMFAPPNSEPQPVGLNSQEIEKYTEKNQFIKDVDVPEEEQERCTVCQCEFETGEEIRNLACTHQFHVSCIDRWLGYNKKCPVCRVDIDQQKVVLVE